MPDDITPTTPPPTEISVPPQPVPTEPVAEPVIQDAPQDIPAVTPEPAVTPPPAISTPEPTPPQPPLPPPPPAAPATPSVSATNNTVDLSQQRQKAKAKIQSRKQLRLEKILEEATKRKKITNDSVQLLLRVSHATATRYLSELEKQGKLKQIGAKKGSFYQI